MTDFDKAVAVVLRHEGGFYHDPVTGEIVNHGITQRFLKLIGIDADETYIRNLTEADAAVLYRKYFWEPYGVGRLDDQRLATKFLDILVNTDPTAVLRALWAALVVDGALKIGTTIGSVTAQAARRCHVDRVLELFQILLSDHYQQVVQANPRLAGKLQGWLARLHEAV